MATIAEPVISGPRTISPSTLEILPLQAVFRKPVDDSRSARAEKPSQSKEVNRFERGFGARECLVLVLQEIGPIIDRTTL